MRKSAFTLVELLAAMAIFTVLMLTLMQFFSVAQGIWTASATKTEMFENSRIALDLISRDLQSAYYNSTGVPCFYENHENDASIGSRIGFMSNTNNAPSGSGKLCKIEYWQDVALKDASSKLFYPLRIYALGDNCDGSGPESLSWEFVDSDGKPLADTACYKYPSGAYADNSGNGWYVATIIPYVLDFKIACYGRDWNDITIPIPTGAPRNLPYAAQISITLMSKRDFTKWQAMGGVLGSSEPATAKTFRQNHQRTFSKMVLIGDRGQYDTQ